LPTDNRMVRYAFTGSAGPRGSDWIMGQELLD